MKRGRWFLPAMPDVVGLLRRQLEATIAGLDGLAAWAGGDAAAAERVREAETRGDRAKRELLEAIRDSFVMPLAPEDLFALSRDIDWILNHARDLIEEAQAMECAPDQAIERMAELLADAARRIDDALDKLLDDPDAAAEAAEAAIKDERRLEHLYYRGMAELLTVSETRERISRRELYRRCAYLGDEMVDVGERIVYAIVKAS